MSHAKRLVRTAFAAFLLSNAVAVTCPGVVPFNRIRPFVLGLPFIFFWVVLLIILALIMLVVTDLIESR